VRLEIVELAAARDREELLRAGRGDARFELRQALEAARANRTTGPTS